MAQGRRLVRLVLVAVVWFLAGCDKRPVSTGGSQPGGDCPPVGGVKGLFEAQCGKCHTLGETAGRKPKGPDLTHCGREHNAGWIADHIRNPKDHKPTSTMPGFAGKLTDEQIQSLAEYLAGMK